MRCHSVGCDRQWYGESNAISNRIGYPIQPQNTLFCDRLKAALFSAIHLTSMCADYWALPVASFGPAVISRIGSKPEITMKTLILAAIRCSLILTAVAALFVQPAQAYTVTLEQMGSNVVANGSGPINFTGL